MIAQFAKEIAKRLNTNTWESGTITGARRRYIPIFDLGDLQDLVVSVSPREFDKERNSRSTNREDYVFDIGVQKKFDAGDENQQADCLVDLCEEICSYFQDKEIFGYDVWKSRYPYILGPEFFRSDRQFTGIVRLFLRGYVAINK